MSDQIKHECGIAFIRLLKPLEYYHKKYGTWSWGLKKLYLLMEKQHNRGQDGAGLVSVKLNSTPGKEYIFRSRSNKREPIRRVFNYIEEIQAVYSKDNLNDIDWVNDNLPFAGEVMLGHLRYGTFGKNDIENVHPVLRRNNWKSKCLALAGNFNLTNVDEVFQKLISMGQHPRDYNDTVTILENIGHFLDEENEEIFVKLRNEAKTKLECTPLIQKNIDIQKILYRSAKRWDGGYVIGGIIGHGDAFVLRDPCGIRPAYYFYNDEIAVVTSERPVIQTVFDAEFDQVKELTPGEAIIVRQDGTISFSKILESSEVKACSFERIYFSRGSDKEIYNERKKLGELLVPQLLKTIDYDVDNSVFSFIPNTAETAFYGMIQAVEQYTKDLQAREIIKGNGKLTVEKIKEIIQHRPRVEKIAIKDIKLRTFITQDKDRDDLVKHVYDVTYGTVNEGKDNLVVIDDSIVRGTTLKLSIIRILDKLRPKSIVIVSSSPQIRYPDCYGIDMAKLQDFIAFRAAIELLHEMKMEHLIKEVYQKCKAQESYCKENIKNYVKEIYEPFSDEEISGKIAQMLKSDDVNSEIKVVYQKVEDLHKACPKNLGDWYFTGNYPTAGGNKVVNKSFINYYEGLDIRAY
jgi:amidophosphoribosyltransferase